MSIRSRRHAVPLAIATGLSLSPFAHAAALGPKPAAGIENAPAAAPGAERDAKDPPQEFEGVEVHGRRHRKLQSGKFTLPVEDTPQTIQIIPARVFQEQGATTLTEALRNTPSVGTFYAGENGATSTGDAIYMRGFDTSNSLYVDGARDLGSVSRDVFNVEQIEVVKGPAGTDNGRSAPSGAINMVSKRAGLEQHMGGTLTLGDNERKRLTADFNQPLGKGMGLRLNGMWQDYGTPGREHVGSKRWGIAPSLGFGLDGATHFWLNLYHVKQDNVPDGFVPTIGVPHWVPQPGLQPLAGHPVDSRNFYGTPNDFDRSTTDMATFLIAHDGGGAWRINNTLRWGRTQQDYRLTGLMSTGGNVANPMAGNIRWTNPADLSTYTLVRGIIHLKDQANTILTNQFNVQADLGSGTVRHALSAGLELTRESLDSRGEATSGALPAVNLYHPVWNQPDNIIVRHTGADSHGRTDTVAVYAFDTISFGEQFLLTGSVRLDNYRTHYHTVAPCVATGAPACAGQAVGTIVSNTDIRASGHLVNWKVGAVYKPAPNVSLYANAALSQQPPGGANFSLSASASSADNPNLDPQKARTDEVGAKWSVNEGRFGFASSLFRTTVSNEINSLVLDERGNPTQTGEKRVEGVEFSASGNITRNWYLLAAYSKMRSRITAGPVVAQDGTPNLNYTPDHGFNLWTTYTLPFGLTLGGGMRNVAGLHKGRDGAVGTPDHTDGYTVYDLMLSQRVSRAITLRLNVQNLTNEHYVAAINKSGYRYTPGAPRNAMLSMDVKF